MINLYTKDNNIFKCNILFTFYENNKNFTVFLGKEEDVLASYYSLDEDKAFISPIMNDSDFDIVDREIERRLG